jgi:hypothetical protein
MRRTSINLNSNLGERKREKRRGSRNDRREPDTTGLVGRRGQLASRIRDPQQTR